MRVLQVPNMFHNLVEKLAELAMRPAWRVRSCKRFDTNSALGSCATLETMPSFALRVAG